MEMVLNLIFGPKPLAHRKFSYLKFKFPAACWSIAGIPPTGSYIPVSRGCRNRDFSLSHRSDNVAFHKIVLRFYLQGLLLNSVLWRYPCFIPPTKLVIVLEHVVKLILGELILGAFQFLEQACREGIVFRQHTFSNIETTNQV